MASEKTLAKRIEERRTWTISWKSKQDGLWYRAPVNVKAAAQSTDVVKIEPRKKRGK